MMARKATFGLFALLLSTPAWAGDVNLSGTYKDIDGGQIEFIQSGSNLMLKPKLKELPEQMKKFVGDIRIKGTVVPKPEDGFGIDASYDQTLEPMPKMKLKIKIDFDASGEKKAEGLVMKTCSWKVSAVVFSGGEIAGSENQDRKCVGLWPKVE